MRTPRLFLVLTVLCFLCPTSSHAVDVYVNPPAPTDVDSVSISAVGCDFGYYGCQFPINYFGCSQVDAHDYAVNVVNYGVNCFPSTEVCFPCEFCEPGYQLGRCELGTLAAGHYVVQIATTTDEWGPVYSQISFDVEATPTGVRAVPPATLLAVVPNPFAASANIEFALTRPAHATLEIFDVRGSRVRTLVDATVDAPGYTAQWDGRDASGSRQPSGIYFGRLTLDGVAVATRRIVLLH